MDQPHDHQSQPVAPDPKNDAGHGVEPTGAEPVGTGPAGAAQPRRRLPGLVIAAVLLALAVPPIGLIVSIIAWRKTVRQKLKGRNWAVFGTVWSIIFTLPFLFFFWFAYTLSGGFHGNDAQKAAKPFITKVQQAGGKKLCDNGDSGYGIDNITPWYTAYYRIPDSAGLTAKLKGYAGQTGYSLTKDDETISQLKQQVVQGDATREQYNKSTDYLVGHDGVRTMQLTVTHDGSVPLDCGVDHYGQPQAADGGDAILTIGFTLPDTQR